MFHTIRSEREKCTSFRIGWAMSIGCRFSGPPKITGPLLRLPQRYSDIGGTRRYSFGRSMTTVYIPKISSNYFAEGMMQTNIEFSLDTAVQSMLMATFR